MSREHVNGFGAAIGPIEAMENDQEEADGDFGSVDGRPIRIVQYGSTNYDTRPSLADTHANLVRMATARELFMKALATKTVELRPDDKESGRWRFFIPEGVEADIIPWWLGKKDEEKLWLWGEAGKMACPTWDLPAGAPQIGGTCPGAVAGQSVVPTALRERTQRGAHSPPGLKTPFEAHLDENMADNAGKNGGTICQYCLAGDARVLVRGRGVVRLDSLVEGERIEVWSGEAWRETTLKFNGLKPTLLLTLTNGQTLRLTGDHQVATASGWVKAENLTEGDRLVPKLPTSGSPFPASVAFPEHAADAPYRTEKRGNWPTSWSRELGVLAGYVLGDGFIYASGKYPSVGLTGSEQDAGDLRRLGQLVSEWTGSEAEVQLFTAPSSDFAQPLQRAANITWRTKSVVALMHTMGVVKDGELFVPESLWTASRDAVAGFLSGLFSTDGSVALWPEAVEVSFANTSRRLVEETQQLLFAFGIQSSVCEYKSNRERGYKPCWKLSFKGITSVRAFAREIGFFNERKSALLAEGLQRTVGVEPRGRDFTVASVTPGKTLEPVFDLLDVGDEHMFVANGITVHNCYAMGGQYWNQGVQPKEILTYWWTEKAIRDGSFAPIVAESLLNDPRLRTHTIHGVKHRPVRLHSSGDFFSPVYAAAWVETCNLVGDTEAKLGLTPSLFWAPTRTWVTWSRSAWKDILSKLKRPNLVVRASAYNLDDAAPDYLVEGGAAVNGNAKGSTSVWKSHQTPGDKRFDYNCPVYAAVEKRDAEADVEFDADGSPRKKKKKEVTCTSVGCRACWIRPDQRINYTTHF